MRIRQIRNATLKIEYADQTILLDPWLQDQGTGGGPEDPVICRTPSAGSPERRIKARRCQRICL